MTLLDHGRRLVTDGSRLLTDLDQVESGLHHSGGRVAGRSRIASFSTAMRAPVASLVGTLLDHHRDLALTLTERARWDTIDLVVSGQQNLGIVQSWGDVPLRVPSTSLTSINRDGGSHFSHSVRPRAGWPPCRSGSLEAA